MSSDRLFSIEGKTALITGGTRGIGYMIAEGYLKAGARKVYVSSRKSEACESAQRALSKFGDVEAIPIDVSSAEQCDLLVEAVEAQEDTLEILVNNAGVTWGTP